MLTRLVYPALTEDVSTGRQRQALGRERRKRAAFIARPAKVVVQRHARGSSAFAFNNDGSLLASAASRRSIKINEVASGRELFTLTPERSAQC